MSFVGDLEILGGLHTHDIKLRSANILSLSDTMKSIASVLPTASSTTTSVATTYPLRDMEQTLYDNAGFGTRAWSNVLPVYPTTYSSDDIAAQRLAGNAFALRLQSAMANGLPATIDLGSGVYRLSDHLIMTNANNITIRGNNATLFTEYANDVFELTQCSNVTLDGLNWDSNALPYLQGEIYNVDTTNRTFDISVFPGFVPEANLASYDNRRFLVFDSAGECISTWCQNSFANVTNLGSGNFRVNASTNSTYWSNPQLASAQLKPHNVVCLESGRSGEGHGGISYFATASRCRDVTFANINVYTGVSHTYGSQNSGFWKHINIRNVPPPGSVRLLGGLPVQFMMRDGDLVFDSCVFDAGFDDAINLLGQMDMVANVQSSNVLVLAQNSTAAATGDTLIFYDKLTSARLGSANVVAIGSLTDSALLANCNQATGALSSWLTSLNRLTLDSNVASIPAYAIVVNSNKRANSVSVSNCYFRNASAQHILARAKNGLVQNNVLENGWNGVDCSAHTEWMEGPVSSNFLIQNNVMKRSPQYASWGSEGPSSVRTGTWGNARPMSNVRILNNSFVDSGYRVLYARNVDDLQFANNTILNPAPSPLQDPGMTSLPDPYVLDIDHCSNVLVRDNYVDMSQTTAQGFVNLGSDVAGYRASNNSIVSINSIFGSGVSGLGTQNTACGTGALRSNSTGSRNAAFGMGALATAASAVCTTAVGVGALGQAGDAQQTVAIGALAGARLSGNGRNVLIGYQSMAFGAGENCVSIGQNAMTFATGTSNVGVGPGVMKVAAGSNNVGVGGAALAALTIGTAHTAIGSSALAACQTGMQNTCVGKSAGNQALGNNLVAVGHAAHLLPTTGSNNTAIGQAAMWGKTAATCSNCTAVGQGSLTNANAASFCTAVGYQSMQSNMDANTNTALGYRALQNLTTYSNCTGVGANSAATGDNQVQLGSSGTTTYAYGAVQDRSDRRDKADVRPTTFGLDFLCRLTPVDFRWDYRDDYVAQKHRVASIAPANPANTPTPSLSAGTAVDVEIRGAGDDAAASGIVQDDGTLRIEVTNGGETDDPGVVSAVVRDRPDIQLRVEFEPFLSRMPPDGTKKRTRFHSGLIAQDLMSVLNDVGEDWGAYQWHERNGGEDVYTVGYAEFIGPLIRAVQELRAKVAALEAAK